VTILLKRIVCLANSKKNTGRCIAGKELGSGKWIRPISARVSHEVSESERGYQDGTGPAVLHVIDVPLLEARPKAYQSENWLLNPKYYWERVAAEEATVDLSSLVDVVPTLWTNGTSSSVGTNDRIDTKAAAELTTSLNFIEVDRGTLRVFAPGAAYGNPKRRVQINFVHRGEPYALWVTDPRVEAEYLKRPDGSYRIGSSYLTVSLGEPKDGFAYKLVAAVIPRRR
jgi:hypothetical protein